MKKLLLLFFILLISEISVNADVLPYYINSLKRYGIGFTQIKSPLVMYQEPKNDSKILEKLSFDYKMAPICMINKTKCELDEIFSVYSESKKIAFLTTIDYTEDWSLVCFNQSSQPVCGWVNDKDNKYYTYSEFFNSYGKKYGLYFFKDVKKEDKVLYSAPFKQTNTVGSVELAKYISPWLIRGNWVLVKVHDFNNQFKTGYLNYRGDNGKLKMFVKF